MSDQEKNISDFFHDQLTPEQEKALRDHLLADVNNAKAFLKAAAMHVHLRNHFNNPGGKSKRFFRSPWVFRISAISSVAAAIAVVVLLVLWQRWLNTPIARMTGAVAAKWITPAPGVGAMANRRQQELAEGFAEFTFPNGAQVAVEGPATFRLESDHSIRLYSGRLTTRVPSSAVGFSVDVPSASVVDLGTQIGVDVSDQNSHVEIFEGNAGVHLANSPTARMDRVLSLASSVNIDPDGNTITDAPPEPLAFTRVDQLEPDDTHATEFVDNYAHRVLNDPALIAYYAFDGRDEVLGRLTNRSKTTAGKFDGQISGASWTVGPTPHSRALAFDGSAARVLVNITDPAPSLTLVARFRIDALDKPYNSLLMSDGNARVDSCHLQISNILRPALLFSNPSPDKPMPWNNYHFHWPNQLDLHSWHFVAVVYDTSAHTVTAWVDDQQVSTLPMLDVTPLTIGAATIGSWTGGEEHTSRSLTGAISKIGIWKRSLAPDELHALYFAEQSNNETN